MAEKTTVKSSAKSSNKVFDVAKPGKQAAGASSRPIIVSNRPIMQDPMMITPADSASQTAPAEPPTSPSLVKVKLSPLTDEEKTTGKESATDERKTASESAASKDKPQDTDAEPRSKKPSEPIQDEAAQNQAATEAAAATDDSAPASTTEASPETVSSTTGAAPADTAADNLKSPDAEPADEATAKLEAEAKQQEELDKLVESREYFLPINAVERRRSKVMAALGLLLIIVLGLALLDLMLDAGFVRVGGIQPLTHLF